MISMDQSILQLYQAGRITRQTALAYADNPEQLLRRMEGAVTTDTKAGSVI